MLAMRGGGGGKPCAWGALEGEGLRGLQLPVLGTLLQHANASRPAC